MDDFWKYLALAAVSVCFGFAVYHFKTFRRKLRLAEIYGHIVDEYSSKWFTLNMLTEQKFDARDCRYIVQIMLVARELRSRDTKSKEPNDYTEAAVAKNDEFMFIDVELLKLFLENSEFMYVGPPIPKRKRKKRELNWDDWLPQGLKPAFAT